MSLELSLAALELPDEGKLEIQNNDGTGTGWIWTLAGPGHPAMIAADERTAKLALKRLDEQERARANGRKWKGAGETPEDLRERNIDYLVSCTLAWNDDMTIDGKPFPCTPQNVRTILSNRKLSIYEQVNEFVRDERSFTRRSPQT